MGIKVKPLKWMARNSDGNLVLSWDAFDPVLGFQVGHVVRIGEEMLCQGTFYGDISQAIAAAEADYQEKMMACLEIVPDSAPPQPNLADRPNAQPPVVTVAMINAADSVLSSVHPGIPDETIRLAIAAALAATEHAS